MANLADIIPAFMVGPNGQRLTPEQIAERQQLAQSLMAQATDTSPNAGGVASILAKGVQGFAAGRSRNQADAAAGANAKASSSNVASMLAGLTGGGSVAPVGQGATVSSPMVAPVQSVSVPQTADASYIRKGLIERGLPEHVADGFLVNFQDESGLNPGINETNPIVPGSRGGFGLYQLTGPRRVAYEQFASQKGVDPSNVDAQLDFLMQEGQGSERGAFEKILSSPDTATAAQTIVNDFLRPSPEHAQSRASRYANLNGSAQPVASAPAPSAPSINPTVIEALSSPYASEQERSVAGLLLNQQMSQQQLAQKQALEAQDPLRQLQLRKAEIEVQGMQNPGSDENFYGNPVAVQNPDGSVAYGQIGNRGTFKPIQLGEGQSFAPPTRTIDAGTETLMVDQAGNVISRTPKNNRTAASETAAGGVEGRVTTERELSAPRDFQAAQNAIDILDQIEKHPGLDLGTGATSLGNRISGTPGYDFQNLVEQAKSGAFLSAIEQLRGLGALSNAEGGAATAATNRMDTATTKEGFLAAVRDYRKIIQQGADRAKNNMKAPEDSIATSPTKTPKRRKFNPATGMLE